jgi:death-on-curing protein
MWWLRMAEVLELHQRLLDQTGGMPGLSDLGLLEAALALPRQTFAGVDLYLGVSAKAAALGFSLIQNHPFVDGNKRIGHAALGRRQWPDGSRKLDPVGRRSPMRT